MKNNNGHLNTNTNTNLNLNLLLSGQLISQTGDKFYMLALSFMVLETTGSAARMGLVLFAGMVPLVTAGLFSGVIVDRVSKKKIIIITDLLRGMIVAFVSLLYYHGSLTFEMILLSQILLGLNSAFFNPTIPSVIPMIVDEEALSKTNAKTQFVSGFSSIAGPALGGILVSLHGYFVVFLLNAVSYLASALLECFLEIPHTRNVSSHRKLSVAFKEGYRYIYLDQKLMIILAMVFVIHFFVGSIEVAIPVIAALLSGQGASNMGYIQTAFGAGAVIMALLLSYVSIKEREAFMLFGAVSLIGLFLFSIGFLGLFSHSQAISWFLSLFLLFSASIVLAGTSFQSLIQKRAGSEMIGRVFGVVSSVGNFSIPFAMLIYGFLLEYVNCFFLLCVSGLLIVPFSLIVSILYRKRKGESDQILKRDSDTGVEQCLL